ncbi:MAG: DUF445 domain-containing protein [Solirubrobacteraceae bacterium]|nr:DUF445 domain-containing protein [Solirubrobacteraceae bacterium]
MPALLDRLTPADEQRLRGLRRMQAFALSLLIAAAAVYLATRSRADDGVWGYVNAAAEAAMVGGLADWFAVTALFRHPLRIPVPHTALIPRRKDEFGHSLQEFFTENFLTEEIVRGRVADARVAERLGEWLMRPGNAERVMARAARGGRIALERINDDEIRTLLESILIPQLVHEPIGPIAGDMLSAVVEDGAHHGLIDLLLGEVRRWLEERPEEFAEIVLDRAPSWSPSWLDERVAKFANVQARRWIGDVLADDVHPARIALDSLLRGLADDLQHDEAVQERAQNLAVRLLEHPQFAAGAVAVFRSSAAALQVALADPHSHLSRRGTGLIREFGEQLAANGPVTADIQRRIEDGSVFVVTTYGDELATVISHTIESWDGEQAARRIELHVGRDLQFIRINGTVVGALAGLAIHAVGALVA